MSGLIPSEKPAVPAGWYADPEMAGTQRDWSGTAWTEHRAPGVAAAAVVVVPTPSYRTNHVFHLIMTLLTVGLWAPFVWLPVGMYNSSQAAKARYLAQQGQL